MFIRHIPIILFVAFFCNIFYGCKRLVDVPVPYTSISQGNVYSTNATAISVLTGLYSQLSQETYYSPPGIGTMSLYAGLGADELNLYSGETQVNLLNCYKNSLSSESASTTVDYWSSIYPLIYKVNAAIDGISSSATLTTRIKDQLLGESYFLRAYFYFYLVNYYGDVPLILGTDYTQNAVTSKTSATQVYTRIVKDLLASQQLLNSNYVDATDSTATPERTRPNKAVATALLSRVYLYMKDYADAESQASMVINDTGFYGITRIDSTFLKNNREAIWQLQPVSVGYNSQDGYAFIIQPTGLMDGIISATYLSSSLLLAFEDNDARRINWVDSTTFNSTLYYFPYKYKKQFDVTVTSLSSVTEYTTLFRLAEQYLIRAEARSSLGEPGAASDLNVIRNRAGLAPFTDSTNSDALMAAIMHERQCELFTEGGQRWLDLKRTGLINTVMPTVETHKGGVWNSYDQLYPIVNSELLLDKNVSQTPGYN